MKLINKIFSNKLAKGIILISGGTAFAQFANVIFSPIITRIYPPEQYGVLTVYTAILGMLTIAGALKYEWGIPISDDEDTAVNVLALSISIITVISTIIFMLLLFFGEQILTLLDGENLYSLRFFIPLGVFLGAIYFVFNQWALREKNFSGISRTKLAQSISQNVAMIGFGFLNFGPMGLIIGRIVGQSAGITSLSKSFFRIERLKRINVKKMIWCMKRFKNFPIFSAPSQVLNTAGVQLPVLFMTSLYGPEVVGFYGLANSIVNLPMTLIGKSVGDVFYSEAASMGRSNPGKLKKLSQKLLIRLILIGAIPLVVLFFAAPQLFTLVYGDKWYEAGVYAQIIAFLVFSRFIFTPVSRIYAVFERQKEALIVDTIRIILMLVAFGIATTFKLTPHNAIISYSIAMSLVYFITYIGSVIILNQEIKKVDN